MKTYHYRAHRAGQTVVAMALVLAFVMLCAAFVLDIGSTQRARAQTKYVCDCAALAGLAGYAANQSLDDSIHRATEICAANGYRLGQDGVTAIDFVGYSHLDGLGAEPTNPVDRFRVSISREVPATLSRFLGIERKGLTVSSTAANMAPAPIDASSQVTIGLNADSKWGWPVGAVLSQFGPQGDWSLGDAYDTMYLADGTTPNPLYKADGWRYYIVIPEDLGATFGSTVVRVELFDPDTINGGKHVAETPSTMVDTNGDLTEPEAGGCDYIYAPPPNATADTKPETFPARSSQTEFTVYDAEGNVIVAATYGPNANTPFWYQREAPSLHAPHVAFDADPAQAQIATDLHWVTPAGFEFDSAAYPQPFRMKVRTVSGSSENGYAIRISARRPDGVPFAPQTHGTTPTSALGVYADGQVALTFPDIDNAELPLASVPEGAHQLVVSNFDTEVGANSLEYRMYSFDATGGQGTYPVLCPAPPGASTSSVVLDQAGNKYYTSWPGTRSATKKWVSDTIDIPAEVIVPRTDGKGHLQLDADGRVIVTDRRPFEGADMTIYYDAGARGATDTSTWEVSYSGDAVGTASGERVIILIR